MIKEVNGNLLTYPNIQVIGHQTNCLGVMGGGIAKQIKALNPKMFYTYYKHCMGQINAHNILGTVQFVDSDNGEQIFANMFGEYSFCESLAPFEENGKPRHTDYDALEECFRELHTWLSLNNKTTVGIPYKLGCGLAGGDWDSIVYPMIEAEFENDNNITLYIVKYEG